MRLLIVAFILFSIPIFASLAYGQNSFGFSTSTSKPFYEPGDRVIITGTLQQVTVQNPVTIIVRDPIGNVYEVGQVTLLNNSFVHEFVLSDDARGGNYTVNIKQGNNTAQIQFQVITGQTQIIHVFDSEIRAGGNYTSLIKYGNVEVSTSNNSITIQMDTTKIQNGPIAEKYTIPKHVIDTTGEQLTVKENGNVVNCTQTESDEERNLECPIQTGTKEITFIGTIVIPEFGAATYILVLGIMTVIIFSKGLQKLR